MTDDKRRLAMAVKFLWPDRRDERNKVYIEARDDNKWAICDAARMCWNHCGEWEYEPLPSNRDEAFIARTRYSLNEAFLEAPEAQADLDRR